MTASRELADHNRTLRSECDNYYNEMRNEQGAMSNPSSASTGNDLTLKIKAAVTLSSKLLGL